MEESTTFSDGQSTSIYTDRTILDMIGFALSTALIMLAAYTPLLATSPTFTPDMHGATHGILFLTMAVFYFVLSHFVKNRTEIIRSTPARIVFLVLGLLLPCDVLLECFAGVFAPLPVSLVLWGAFGLSSAFFSCAWVDAQSVLGEARIRKTHLRAFGMAGLITAIVLCMPAQTGVVVFVALSIASAVLLQKASCTERLDAYDHDDQWFNDSKQYSINGSYAMLIDGLTIGMIAGLLVARVSKGVLPPVSMGVALICVALLFMALNKKAPSLLALGKSQMFFMPLIICGFIFSGFLDAPFNTIAAFPLFIIMYQFDYVNSLVLSARGSIISVSPSLCFSRGRFFIVAGQAAGWFLGGLLASDAGHGSMGIASVLLIALMCVYVTLAVIKPDKYSLTSDPSFDADSLPEPAAEQSTIEYPPPEAVVERPYKRKCSLAIATYGLTPREGEILFYLAKGRNAKHIAEQLFVAERTVKTHTYHIYQKMGIHSQQELIDIIEREEE